MKEKRRRFEKFRVKPSSALPTAGLIHVSIHPSFTHPSMCPSIHLFIIHPSTHLLIPGYPPLVLAVGGL